MNQDQLFEIIGVDFYGGDYFERKVSNYREALEAARSWVNDYNKCATYNSGTETIYLKYIRKTAPDWSLHHHQCTTFVYGKISNL